MSRRGWLLVTTMLFGVLAPLTQNAARASSVPPPAPVLPAATYKSVSEELLISMDDGKRLAATVAYPSIDGKTRAPGRFPVVVGLTPYGRNGVCGCIPPSFFSTRGMVGAVVDVRGTGGSEGDLSQNFFSPREAKDGYNVIEYFGTRSYSSGKVGMAGGSYVGITQYLTAEQQPPHLAAITPAVAISDLYRDGFSHGGIENLSFDLQYIAVQGAPGAAGTNTSPGLIQESVTSKAKQSPLGSIAFDYLKRPTDDAFYRDRSPIYHADRIKVPVLDIGQWHDGLLRGETEMYRALASRPGVETRLLMDPCTHKGCGAPFAPFTAPSGLVDESAFIFEFLQQHLLGKSIPKRPKVEFYLQSARRYVEADSWPPAGTRLTRYLLGPGDLSLAPVAAGTESYAFDPAAGLSMSFDQYGTVAGSPYIPTDQRLEDSHGLTFRTSVSRKSIRLTGPIALHLVAASSANDTDWYAKLADVAPDGSESIITAGALRASHRATEPTKSYPGRPFHTHVHPTPIEPGVFYGYDIEIWQTAYELAPGHSLQLRLTSSDLPTHFPGSVYVDKQHPKDTVLVPNPPATNTVRLGDSYLLVSLG